MTTVSSKGVALPLRALNHVSRVCSDVEISCAFYRDVMGFYEVKRPSSFDFEGAWLFNYGIGIHLIRGIPLPRPASINPKSDHLSFQAGEGLEAMEARLSSMGLPFAKQQVIEGNVRVTQLFLHDPDNNMIEICNCELLPVVPLGAPAVVKCLPCTHPCPIAASPPSSSSLSSDMESTWEDTWNQTQHSLLAPFTNDLRAPATTTDPSPITLGINNNRNNISHGLSQGMRRTCSTSVLSTRRPARPLHV